MRFITAHQKCIRQVESTHLKIRILGLLSHDMGNFLFLLTETGNRCTLIHRAITSHKQVAYKRVDENQSGLNQYKSLSKLTHFYLILFEWPMPFPQRKTLFYRLFSLSQNACFIAVTDP